MIVFSFFFPVELSQSHILGCEFSALTHVNLDILLLVFFRLDCLKIEFRCFI
jgi:hypothetical protein